MNNLLSGLEKFGLSMDEEMDLFADDKKKGAEGNGQAANVEPPKEEDFLLDKKTECTVCGKEFIAKALKSGKLKRLESDEDLRPRHEYMDTLKYSVTSCPYCGYTAINRNFKAISSAQMKYIREGICSKFKNDNPTEQFATYSYDKAIDMYKLALFNSIAKKGKTSEKAYICLNISWLLRGKAEEIENNPEGNKALAEVVRKEELAFYQQAYEGFLKAIASEMFPMCGMEESTVEYMMAVIAMNLGKMDVASRFVSSILGSQAANRRLKDKALELKGKIIAKIKEQK